MLDREKLTSHINNPELLLKIRRLIDKAEISLRSHLVVETDFMDPYERRISISILQKIPDLKYLQSGGPEEAERRFLVLFPDYMSSYEIESNSSYIRIDGDIANLTHRDFLGSLMNLGIKREKIGDIVILGDFALISSKPEVAGFILLNLEKVGSTKVQCSIIDESSFKIPKQEYVEQRVFITSERLDVIVSAIYKLSRSESLNKINAGDIKVNWETIHKPNHETKPGDMISARGFGRSIYFSKVGVSKKGRLSIIIKKLK